MMLSVLSAELNALCFSPFMLVQNLFPKGIFDKNQTWRDQLPSLILKGGAILAAGGLSSYLTPKTDTRFSHLIPATLTGVASAVAKLAFDFLAARPSAFNFCSVPTKDLVDLVHWGFVSSLTLRSDPSEKPTGQQTEEPIKVSKEEALHILEKAYSLEGALKLFREEPIKISQEDFSKLVEKDSSLQGVSTYFQTEHFNPNLVEEIDGKEKQAEDSLSGKPKAHQGESSSSESSPAEGLKGTDEIAKPVESEEERLEKKLLLREELSSWISKINLEEAPPPANPPEKDSSSGMSLQEGILCWIGQANFFDQKNAFSKDAQTKANTVAYFVASAIASETLKQAHPILLNTASCLSLAAISAIAMPIISAVNRRLFSSAADHPCLKDVLFYADAAAALVSYYVIPKLLPGSSLLRIAAIQTVSFLALSALATYWTFSKRGQGILARIQTSKEIEEASQKRQKVTTAIIQFKATDEECQKLQKVKTALLTFKDAERALREAEEALPKALKELAAFTEKQNDEMAASE